MELGIDIVENLFLTFEIPNCGGEFINFYFETFHLTRKKTNPYTCYDLINFLSETIDHNVKVISNLQMQL